MRKSQREPPEKCQPVFSQIVNENPIPGKIKNIHYKLTCIFIAISISIVWIIIIISCEAQSEKTQQIKDPSSISPTYIYYTLSDSKKNHGRSS